MSEEFCEVEVSRINRPKIDVSNIDPGILDLVRKMNLPELPPEVQHEPGTILLRCSDCNRMKPIDEFHADNGKFTTRDRHGRHRYCKPCSNGHATKYNKTMNGKMTARNTGLKKKYKIDHAEYERMLAAQGGGCAICQSKEPGGKGRFAVDHDHVTGKIRGLLCTSCNCGLGRFRDDSLRLRLAADYIEKHQHQHSTA